MQSMNNEQSRLPMSSNGNSTAAKLDGTVDRNAIEPEATIVASPESPTCQPRILYVDDEPAISKVVEKLLNIYGFDAVMAHNGEEALRIIIAQRDSIDLVVLDEVMPKMTGVQCLRELREVGLDIRTIMVSGHLSDAVRQEAFALGAPRFIEKPFRMADLVVTLRDVLEDD
jgi:DNA-binding response OmpR family regulator